MTQRDAVDVAANRIWFDTEFIEDGKTIELVSIGLVAEDGRTYYAEVEGVDYSRADPWLHANVFPHLTGETKPRDQIAAEIQAFAGERPEFWAYYADYDWVALCQLYGRMIDLPKGWPMFCRDVKQLADAAGNPKLPEQTTTEHHALADAIDTKAKWEFLAEALRSASNSGAEAMREAAAKVAEDAGKPWVLHTATGAMAFRAATEKIAAAIRTLPAPGAPASPWRVKPLVWEERWTGEDDDIPVWSARNPLALHICFSFAGHQINGKRIDRLFAPDVGLTRYDLTARHSEVLGYTSYHVEPSDDGEWVKYEDVAPLLAAARAVPADVKLADLIAALENGTQADEDGVMVTVSRQACHEAAKILKARQRKVLPDPLQPKCQHCNDTGLVAINATTGIYARPGPVPDDARGYAEAPCWECNVYPGGFDGPTGAD